jgi:hypothetical protein
MSAEQNLNAEPAPKKAKPTHYKIVCISLYTPDITRLNEQVAALRQRGYTRVNKSQLIRMALELLDLDQVAMLLGRPAAPPQRATATERLEAIHVA